MNMTMAFYGFVRHTYMETLHMMQLINSLTHACILIQHCCLKKWKKSKPIITQKLVKNTSIKLVGLDSHCLQWRELWISSPYTVIKKKPKQKQGIYFYSCKKKHHGKDVSFVKFLQDIEMCKEYYLALISTSISHPISLLKRHIVDIWINSSTIIVPQLWLANTNHSSSLIPMMLYHIVVWKSLVVH